MISVLGNYYYDFPKEIPLKLRLKDMLEEKVDEKYYLSEKMINFFKQNEQKQKEHGNGFRFGVTDGNCIGKAITTRAGGRMDDNFIEDKCQVVGNLNIPGRMESACRIHGIAPACNTCGGGGLETKIAEPTILTPKRTEYGKAIRKDYEAGLHKESRHNFTQLEPKQEPTSNTITTVQKDNMLIEPPPILGQSKNDVGYKFAYDGDGLILQRPWAVGSTVMSQCANTIRAQNPSDCGVYTNYRIRKLTPKECWRLMGFDDSDFDKAKASGVSNSQLYKQAGNSIVVNVLEAIFKQIL